jgi:hypothetical protein
MRKHLIVAISVLVVVASSASSALAAWGCGVRAHNGSWGNSFAQPTRKVAIAAAMKLCESQGDRCHVIGCSPNVDTQERERELWPIPSAPTQCTGSAKC